MPSEAKMIDEGFLGRVYKTSVVIWAFGALAIWSLSGWHTALGWTIGSAISVGLLAGIEWIVRRTIRPGNLRAKKALANVAALHWPIILAIMALAIWLSGRRIPYLIAFIAGLGLAQAVIVLKTLGVIIVERLNEK
jgi:hypothetical protein